MFSPLVAVLFRNAPFAFLARNVRLRSAGLGAVYSTMRRRETSVSIRPVVPDRVGMDVEAGVNGTQLELAVVAVGVETEDKVDGEVTEVAVHVGTIEEVVR